MQAGDEIHIPAEGSNAKVSNAFPLISCWWQSGSCFISASVLDPVPGR